MKWIGDRISFDVAVDKTTIVIEPEKNRWMNIAMSIWLALWVAIGVILIWSLANMKLTNSETIMIIVILSFWLYYLYTVSKQLLWLVYGKELLKIDKRGLVYKKDIKSYGKATLYYYDNMGEFESYVPKKSSFQYVWESTPWTKGGERLQFNYHGKNIRFGIKLDEVDAKLLYQLLNSKRKEYAKMARREEKANNE